MIDEIDMCAWERSVGRYQDLREDAEDDEGPARCEVCEEPVSDDGGYLVEGKLLCEACAKVHEED